MPEIANCVEQLDWLLPTEIQAESIPLILGGGDVLMASETGSGKTGAFCLPIIQVVWESINDKKAVSDKSKNPSDTVREWCLSFTDRARDLALSSDYLTAYSKSGSWQGCRATRGLRMVGAIFHNCTFQRCNILIYLYQKHLIFRYIRSQVRLNKSENFIMKCISTNKAWPESGGHIKKPALT